MSQEQKDNPLLRVIFVSKVIKYVVPKSVVTPLELATVTSVWSETVQTWFGAAHFWKDILAQYNLRHTVTLYMLMSIAAANGSAWLVSAMCDAGVSPDAGNPLSVAARFGRTKVVKALLDSGRRLQVNNPDRGFTPLQHAVKRKFVKIVELFCQYKKKAAEQVVDADDKDFVKLVPLEINKPVPSVDNSNALYLAKNLSTTTETKPKAKEKEDDIYDEYDEEQWEEDEVDGREFYDVVDWEKQEAGGAKPVDINVLSDAQKKERIIKLLEDAGATLPSAAASDKKPAIAKKNEPDVSSIRKIPARRECFKCHLKFSRSKEIYSCSRCNNMFCNVCFPLTLSYSMKQGGNICNPCANEIVSGKK